MVNGNQDRAEKIKPDDPKVLLCVARVNHELENYGIALEAYGRLREIAPEIANRYSYLVSRGEESSRAADLNDARGDLVWEEE